jgi:hypothetical protein
MIPESNVHGVQSCSLIVSMILCTLISIIGQLNRHSQGFETRKNQWPSEWIAGLQLRAVGTTFWLVQPYQVAEDSAFPNLNA